MLRHNWGLESEHATKPFKAKKRSISKCISFCLCNLSLRRENKYAGQRLILQEVFSCIFSIKQKGKLQVLQSLLVFSSGRG